METYKIIAEIIRWISIIGCFIMATLNMLEVIRNNKAYDRLKEEYEMLIKERKFIAKIMEEDERFGGITLDDK